MPGNYFGAFDQPEVEDAPAPEASLPWGKHPETERLIGWLDDVIRERMETVARAAAEAPSIEIMAMRERVALVEMALAQRFLEAIKSTAGKR